MKRVTVKLSGAEILAAINGAILERFPEGARIIESSCPGMAFDRWCADGARVVAIVEAPEPDEGDGWSLAEVDHE